MAKNQKKGLIALALLLGLPATTGVIFAILISLPISVLFIALGILLGALVGERSAPGVSSVVVQLVAFTGGMYFDGALVGNFFATVCRLLPFSSATELLRWALQGTGGETTRAWVTLGLWTVLVCALAVLFFARNMLRGKK